MFGEPADDPHSLFGAATSKSKAKVLLPTFRTQICRNLLIEILSMIFLDPWKRNAQEVTALIVCLDQPQQ